MIIEANKHRELAEAREEKRQMINQCRDAVLEKGFRHRSGAYVSATLQHQIGLQNLLISTKHPSGSNFNGLFKTKTRLLPMSEQEMVSLVTEVLAWASQVQQAAIEHKLNIFAECANTSEVRAYDITVDWP